MKLRNIKIGHRLILAFTGLVLLTVLLGGVSLWEIHVLAAKTENIFQHPLIVSNTLRDIRLEVLVMHELIQDMVALGNTDKLADVHAHIIIQEQELGKKFTLLYERYLGNRSDIEQAEQSFRDWFRLIEKAQNFLAGGNIPAANSLIQGEENGQLEDFNRKIERMMNFAGNRARQFQEEANATRSQAVIIMLLLMAITFLGSLVVGTLITRSITRPLQEIVSGMTDIAAGIIDRDIHIVQQDEIGRLADSFRLIQSSFRSKVSIAKKISQGDFSAQAQPQSSEDELAIALNSMTASLAELYAQNSRQNWIKTGQAELSILMQGEKDVPRLAQDIIAFLSHYLGGQVGTIYTRTGDTFRLVGSYAYTWRKNAAAQYQLGEGLIGQAALEKTVMVISQIPPDYLPVVSGLGESNPRHLVLIPCLHNNEVRAVIEVGSLHELAGRHIEFVESVRHSIGISINSAESRAKVQILLAQTQEQTQKLQSANLELEQQAARLKESEEELKMQQEELMAINEELEEKTESLEKQKSVISQSNQELQQTRLDLERKARELEISSRYKSQFLANMSHELRTPLNSMLILSQDLLANKAGRLNDEDIQSVQIVYNSGNDLLRLINEILDLSKIESGKMTLHIEAVPLCDISESLAMNFRHVAADKGLSLSVRQAADLPPSILSDRQKIEQILKNLIANAIKFTEQGEVAITIQRPAEKTDLSRSQLQPDQSLAFEVRDSGIGIPPDKHLEIFEAFQQVDGSTSRKYGGSGLGLSISRELAKLLGGEIQLTSQPGVGSTFTVYLPERLERRTIELPERRQRNGALTEERRINPETPMKSDHAITAPINPPLSPINDDRAISSSEPTILLIEDDHNFAAVIKNFCHERKFRFLHAPSGEDGLNVAKTYRPDAIILDIKLPGIDGWQVLSELKANPTTRHIPIHMMSALEESREAYYRGAVGYLTKPVNVEKLQAAFGKIENLLAKTIKDLLIIEDDPALCLGIRKLIGNGDVKVAAVSSGQEAIAELQRQAYDCIILDLGLPDMSGFDLLKRLQECMMVPPVIVYTGRELTNEEEYDLEKYARSIIIKGVKSEERLLDETALFLHRMVEKMPPREQTIINRLHDKDLLFVGKKVLVVDDDMRNVFAIAKVLEGKQMTIIKAAHGQKALDILDQEPDIDIVLMDIMMPVMDGYEAIRQIRRRPSLKKLPIIALTAKAMKDDRDKCIEAGANDYLSKPVDIPQLLSLLRVWLYN